MDIKITLDIPALDALVKVLAAGAAIPNVASKTKPGLKAPPAPDVDAASRGSVQASSPSVAEDVKPEPDNTEVTLDDVKAAAKAFAAKNSREALGELINRHGGSGPLSTLPVDNFAAFIAEANA